MPYHYYFIIISTFKTLFHMYRDEGKVYKWGLDRLTHSHYWLFVCCFHLSPGLSQVCLNRPVIRWRFYIILLLLSVLAATGLLPLNYLYYWGRNWCRSISLWSVDQVYITPDVTLVITSYHREIFSNELFGFCFILLTACRNSVEKYYRDSLYSVSKEKKSSALVTKCYWGFAHRFDKKACAGIIRQMWMLYA